MAADLRYVAAPRWPRKQMTGLVAALRRRRKRMTRSVAELLRPRRQMMAFVAEPLQRWRQIYKTWRSCYRGGGRVADRVGAAMGRGGG